MWINIVIVNIYCFEWKWDDIELFLKVKDIVKLYKGKINKVLCINFNYYCRIEI